MLYLIGLGLDKKDISLKALEAIKKCKSVYFEIYTNVMVYSKADIEKTIGKKIKTADRKFVEEKNDIFEESEKGHVALLIAGDPLAATTHIDLILRAKKRGIKTEVIHATSIFTAIADTGLQLYKFGKTASIAKWTQNFKPESFYDIIHGNEQINAHSLLLIDIGLSVNEAIGYLESVAKAKDSAMLARSIIVCEQAGTSHRKFTMGRMSDLVNQKFKLPACIIIPSKLHFVEEEALGKI